MCGPPVPQFPPNVPMPNKLVVPIGVKVAPESVKLA
jgi:hypothetical protein